MSATIVVSSPDAVHPPSEVNAVRTEVGESPAAGAAEADEAGPKRRAQGSVRRLLRVTLATGGLLGVAAVAAALAEMRTSFVQARLFSDAALTQIFEVRAGPSDAIAFPAEGPYDLRLGYARLPAFLARLQADGAALEAQARWSPEMLQTAGAGLNVPYAEKASAGLTIVDRDEGLMSASRWPERVYPTFDEVPKLVRDALVFIENRELLAPESAQQNPAVEWDRLAMAVGQLALRQVEPEQKVHGASTLATQLEKFRHSPEGRTHGSKDKLRQMASASLRAYRHGEDTTVARREIVLDYVNTVPLGAVPGYGEVQGIGDALWAWFGTDFDVANNLLADDFQAAPGHPDLARRARAYRQVLGLFLAQRRPQNFLVDDRAALDRLIDEHLGKLRAAGLIDAELADAARKAPLGFRRKAVSPPEPAFHARKAADAVRTHLLGRLGLSRLYDLDRLDLTVHTTFDGPAQQAASRLLAELREPEAALKAGLREPRLLGKGDPAQVLYSFTLFERGEGANLLRVQTDSFDGPFNLNDGMKLELGSTAKLRTLVTYLELVADLHARLSQKTPAQLADTPADPSDALTRWAVGYLAAHPGAPLAAMLEAALDREYSASPAEAFMTGGGLHRFGNFNPHDDRKVFSVRQATYESVNLVYIRLMRDVVRHLMFQVPGSSARLLQDAADPRRRDYLARFAEAEGRVFQEGFYKKYRGRSPDEILDLLVQSVKPTPRRLATVYRFVRPEATLGQFASFLVRALPDSELSPEGLAHLYEKYAPDAFGLADQGFLAKLHPLELWTAGYLRSHPAAPWAEVAEASRAERQAVYQWLFRTSRKNAQDKRIKALLEVEAFLAIHRQWRRLGYPFPSLVASYATALGSSGDRPTALAELMGILQNDGLRLPTERVESLDFAVATPYESHVRRPYASAVRAERVLPSEVARAALATLQGVVEQGTAKRVRGAFRLSDGRSLSVAGKTGTGDNRRDAYARGGKKLRSTVQSRTATFAFAIGDRWFGVLTAYVPGAQAAQYEFTSALPSTLLKLLAKSLLPSLMERTLVRGEGDRNAPRRWQPATPRVPAPSAFELFVTDRDDGGPGASAGKTLVAAHPGAKGTGTSRPAPDALTDAPTSTPFPLPRASRVDETRSARSRGVRVARASRTARNGRIVRRAVSDEASMVA